MAVSPQDLANAFLQTLSPAAEQRKAAEAFLAGAARQPGYALAVLGLVAQSLVDAHVCQAAAVAFKNHVKYSWTRPVDDLVDRTPIQARFLPAARSIDRSPSPGRAWAAGRFRGLRHSTLPFQGLRAATTTPRGGAGAVSAKRKEGRENDVLMR